MKPCITAIGTANPPYKTAQRRIADFMVRAHGFQGTEKTRLQALYRATGIRHRYSVLKDYGVSDSEYEFYTPGFNSFPSTGQRNETYRKHALPLALEALKDCLTQGFDRSSVSHLITVSCTGFYAPGLDIELVEVLGLRPETKRIGINFMGCYAAFNALRTAAAICGSQPNARVLVVCVELCSLHFQKDPQPDFVLSNALFGDGAAALVVENSTMGLQLLGDHCTLVAAGKEDMYWKAGDTGFEMALSTKVPELILEKIVAVTGELLDQLELRPTDLDYYAIHPGGKRIISAIQQALGLSDKDCGFSTKVLREYGNMSSPTILFVLKEIWDNLNTRGHGKKVLCFAFGPGLTLESMVLKITGPRNTK